LPKVLGVSIAGISRIENGYYNKPAPDLLWLFLDVLEPVHPVEKRLVTLEDLLLIGTEFWNPNVEV
jgi:transcriptional regulator with XRE-family HTH domain